MNYFLIYFGVENICQENKFKNLKKQKNQKIKFTSHELL